MSEREWVLEVEGLVRRYGAVTAVDGLSFQVARGEAYGLLGPNGAGKSTAIRAICGLTRPDAGQVRIAGVSMQEQPRRAKARLGLVPQEVALYHDLSARENLRFFAGLYGLSGAKASARIERALALTRLSDRGDRRVSTFSGGMQRRLNIAAALLHEPELLILDESTVGVDPQSRAAILDGIAAWNAEGMAVVYTSHYMEEVEQLCHRIGIVDGGRMLAEGTRGELIERLDRADRIELTVEGPEERLATRAAEFDGVEHASFAPGSVTLLARRGSRLLPELLAAAHAIGATVTTARVHEPDLEAVFLHLTGRTLRDAA